MKRYNSIDAIELFTTGFITGLVIGFVIAWLIVENMPQVFV